jgi:hypothetical protein
MCMKMHDIKRAVREVYVYSLRDCRDAQVYIYNPVYGWFGDYIIFLRLSSPFFSFRFPCHHDDRSAVRCHFKANIRLKGDDKRV